MKYYLYTSATKVEMLYPQIPPDFLKSLSAELSFNIGVVATKLKAEATEKSDNLFSKVEIVSKYIKQSERVGTVENPEEYIAGALPLRYGVRSDYRASIVFFGSRIGTLLFGMIGSPESLIGAKKNPETSEHSVNYYVLKFLRTAIEDENLRKTANSEAFGRRDVLKTLVKILGKMPEEASPEELKAAVLETKKIHGAEIERSRAATYSTYRKAFDQAFNGIPDDTHNLEFLAKTLHKEDQFVTATPIY